MSPRRAGHAMPPEADAVARAVDDGDLACYDNAVLPARRGGARRHLSSSSHAARTTSPVALLPEQSLRGQRPPNGGQRP